MEKLLELINIHKSYENQPLLRGVEFSAAEGETICLLGSSGSGKSTILRIISGLEVPESGEVRWQGKNLAGKPVHQRKFGLMFQDYALFPHMNVSENIAFGLQMQNWSGADIDKRVVEILIQTGMRSFSKRKVTDLSGGEQQRVALGRALAPFPRLLMLDEPLGALDRSLRESLSVELRDVLHKSGIPAVYVTHDQQEAFAIADTIILLHDGKVVQSGSPKEVVQNPVNPWAAEFLGLGNILNGKITEDGISTDTWEYKINHNFQIGQEGSFLLRPKAEMVHENETLTGVVKDVIFRGQDFRVELTNGLYFFLQKSPSTGQKIKIRIEKIEML